MGYRHAGSGRYSTKYSSSRSESVARQFGSGVRADEDGSLVGCGLRLS
jgi:hypothetical protein